MKPKFLLLFVIVVAISISAFAQGRRGGMGSGIGPASHMGQWQGMGSGSQMGQWQGVGQMGDWQQIGRGGQGSQTSAVPAGPGPRNNRGYRGRSNSNRGPNGSTQSGGVPQDQRGNSRHDHNNPSVTR